MWGDDQLNAATKCGNQENRCAMTAQRCPPKGALQNAKSWGKIFKKLESCKPHGSTTKCQTRRIFLNEKMVLVQKYGPVPGGLWRTIFGPNLRCTKPGLMSVVEEIQTPISKSQRVSKNPRIRRPASDWSIVLVFVLGLYLFVCSLPARFCFVWIKVIPP